MSASQVEGGKQSPAPRGVLAALAPTSHPRGHRLWEKAGSLGEKLHAETS
jgi:hypothetical protein